MNLCRGCKVRTGDCGIYLQSGGPPCGEAARWDAEPDRFELPPMLASAWRFARGCWVILNDMAGR